MKKLFSGRSSIKIEFSISTETVTSSITDTDTDFWDTDLERDDWEKEERKKSLQTIHRLSGQEIPTLKKEKVTFSDSTYFIRPSATRLSRRRKKMTERNLIDCPTKTTQNNLQIEKHKKRATMHVPVLQLSKIKREKHEKTHSPSKIKRITSLLYMVTPRKSKSET